MNYTFECGCRWPVIQEAENPGELPLLDFSTDDLPDCKAVWDLLGRGETKGIFQLESGLGRQWTKKLKPESLEHIGALGSILRPGALFAVDDDGVSTTQHYCRRKNELEEVEEVHPALAPILEPTYNLMIFQEQCMAIAVAVAGFSLSDADSLRKAIGKKDAKVMAEVKQKFLEGVKREAVVSEELGQELFDDIEKSQRYSFNKCLSSDTIIKRPRGGKDLKLSIGEIYRIRNDIEYAKQTGHKELRAKWRYLKNYGNGLSMCEDGRIRPNTIVDIQPSGTRKVFRITLEGGGFVDGTTNHKFPTDKGEKTVSEILLNPSSYCLFVSGSYEPTDNSVYKFSELSISDIRNPHNLKAVDGQFGENNYFYTNGSYSDFVKAQKTIPMVCNKCGAGEEKRLELHHINGDRTNSKEENLERLCASCHKKKEYQAGRTKRYEKGYPTYLCKIVSIECIGEKETFDVTMEAPHHNFVVNDGIVTCNSHAYSYGVTGYETAYIKTHFPVQFFTAWLNRAKHEADPYEKIAELVLDARMYDVDVQPPNITHRQDGFSCKGQEVFFGMLDIKGVGEAAVKNLNRKIAEAESFLRMSIADWSWEDFLFGLSTYLPPTVVEKLIRCGALRKISELSRQQMLQQAELWNSLTDLEKHYVCTKRAAALGLIDKQEYEYKQEGLMQAKEEAEPKSATYKGIQSELRANTHLLSLLNDPQNYSNLIEALRDVGRTKKEGGGCQNEKRVSHIQSCIHLIENPVTELSDSPIWISWSEEELLGVSLTCTKIESCDLSQVNTKCRDFVSTSNDFLVFGVEVQSLREVVTKRGKKPGQKMAFLSVMDATGSVPDVVCFPDTYKEFKHVLYEGNTVILQGEKDERDGDLQLVVKKVFQAEEI